MGERGGHAIVLETARRIESLVLQEQTTRFETHISANDIGSLQECLAFADGHDLVGFGKGQ